MFLSLPPPSFLLISVLQILELGFVFCYLPHKSGDNIFVHFLFSSEQCSRFSAARISLLFVKKTLWLNTSTQLFLLLCVLYVLAMKEDMH